jgi:hypothetical protein
MRRIIRRTVCTAESTTDLAVLFRTRFKTLWRSEICINLKIDADASVAFASGAQYIISIRESEGSMLVSAHTPTVYAVGRIKSKTKQILPTVFQPNLT